MYQILLTDAQQRKTLATIRSLGIKGVRILAAEETRYATATFSRYCCKSFVYPSPKKKPVDFYYWLKNILQKYQFKTFFPMDDNVLEIVMNHREQLDKICMLPLPSIESYLIASDKAQSIKIAKKVGIDCPKTIMLKNFDTISEIASTLTFPVIIKPRKSSGSRGIKVVWRKEDLYNHYIETHEKFPFPIIQEFISQGDKYDVCLLFNKYSQLKASFVQKEIRHFPINWGPSTVQESVSRPDLVEKATHLMQRLNWYGVADVEFMVDPKDGKEKFMEINPRFWGSLHLAILAGVDFPWLLYQLAIDRDIKEVFNYSTGIKCRWLLPGDILHFIYNKKRFEMEPSFFSNSKSGVYDDIISWHDPLPVLGFFLACLSYIPNREMWKFMFQR